MKKLLTLSTAILIGLPATAMAADQDKWGAKDQMGMQQGQSSMQGQMDTQRQAGTQGMMDQQMDRQAGIQQQDRMQIHSPNQQLSQATIRDIQSSLDQRGYDVGQVDGIWGPRTERALQNFQQARNVPVTGRPDQTTLSELNVQPEMRGQATQQQTQRTAAQLQRDTVEDIQRSLRQAGLNPGPVDGIWGPRTASAVRNFQQQNNLEATGTPDQRTLDQLGVQQRG